MTPEDRLVARVSARGEWQAMPAVDWVEAGHDDGCAPGCVMEHRWPVPAYALTWWPSGQGHGGNPFCERSVLGPTLAACFERMEELTRPVCRSIDELVAWARFLAEGDPAEYERRRRQYHRRTA